MKEPLVSVIVGVYNKERYVGECLQSVLAQTYPRFELIVVDDASTDGSFAAIQKIQDDRLRIVRMTANSGLPAIPRNRGLALARGEYVAFLDADDRWLDQKLHKQVDFMRRRPEFPLTHTGCYVIDSAGMRKEIRHQGSVPPSGEYFRGLMNHCWICLSTVMLRRDLVDKIGLFNESPDYLTGEDWEFFWRTARYHPIGFLEEPLAEYRKHENNICKIGWNWRGTPRDYLTLNRFFRRRELWEGVVTPAELKEALLDAANENSHYWRIRLSKGKAAWFAWQMVRLAPWDARGWRHLAAAALRRKP